MIKSFIKFFFTIIFLFYTNLVFADSKILDKESAFSMFALSKLNWNKNVIELKRNNIGNYQQTPDGTYTLYYRPDPMRGLLIITPVYAPNNPSKPFKISITILNDKKFDNDLYNSMNFEKASDLIKEASKNLQPEFSVMGHLQKGVTSSVNFTIFEKGKFPIIDDIVEKGKVCPPKNGKQMCIMGKN